MRVQPAERRQAVLGVAEYRLSGPAEAQIDEILNWSQEKFGELTRERYAALLVKAMEDVADYPRQKSVSWKGTSSGTVGIYHISRSREHVSDPPGTIGEPRHYLVFRVGRDGIVDILGFIHERMLFSRALRRLLSANRDN
jgi:toxin ParE1/3/4